MQWKGTDSCLRLPIGDRTQSVFEEAETVPSYTVALREKLSGLDNTNKSDISYYYNPSEITRAIMDEITSFCESDDAAAQVSDVSVVMHDYGYRESARS